MLTKLASRVQLSREPAWRRRKQNNMAAPLQVARRFLRLSGNPIREPSRSAFRAQPDDINRPNWVKVGLSFGASIAIWVLLLKQHNEHQAEYERRKAERGS
ncbi:NADH dehydrogenase [ubiquinone] 1 subunit C1, mitochondrial isoform X2 [Podarcis muralis]